MPVLLFSVDVRVFWCNDFFNWAAEGLRSRLDKRELSSVVWLRNSDRVAMLVELNIRAARFRIAKFGQIRCLGDCSSCSLPHAQLGCGIQQGDRCPSRPAQDALLLFVGHD